MNALESEVYSDTDAYRFSCSKVDHSLDSNMMKETMMDTPIDWRYSDERMDVRTHGTKEFCLLGSEICSENGVTNAIATEASMNAFMIGCPKET